MGQKRSFGQIQKLPSGRFRARYADPEGQLTAAGEPVRLNAPYTFQTKGDAEAWLVDERRLISTGTWRSPSSRKAQSVEDHLAFGTYAESWMANRKVKGQPLAARTRDHYRALLDAHILPTFTDVTLTDITPDMVDQWYESVAKDRETTRAHAYSLLRTILGTAVDRRLITQANPARIRGGGSTQRAKKIRPASLEELETIAKTVPARHQLMVLLASWCALRFGELVELRRNDIDLKSGVIRVRRGVVRTKSGTVIKAPKSDAGIRDVAIPPHLIPTARAHLLEHVARDRDALLFPGTNGNHLSPSAFYGRAAALARTGAIRRKGWGYYEARRVAEREDLRFHDLRHTGAVLAAQTGATLVELMNRLGHSTPGAALRYQHAAEERDKEIARRLSALVAT